MYYAIYMLGGTPNKKNSDKWEDVEHLPNIIDLIKSDTLTTKDFNDMFSLMRLLNGNR